MSVAQTGTGKPFIFQHGLCGAAGQPAQVFPQDTGWACMTLECRGHGMSESGDPAAFSIAQFAEDVAAFINALNIGPVLLGGISMGAAIALHLAVKRPELVSGLVVARPAWIDQPAPENLAPNREVAQFLAEYEPGEALSLFESSPIAQRLRKGGPDNLASLLGFFQRFPLSETQALLSAIASDGPGISSDEIANLSCPTLVIGTARDVIHPLAMAEEVASLIPRARFVEITPKGDDAERYQADFQTALRQFLKEID